jgi:hypothetical protein
VNQARSGDMGKLWNSDAVHFAQPYPAADAIVERAVAQS